MAVTVANSIEAEYDSQRLFLTLFQQWKHFTLSNYMLLGNNIPVLKGTILFCNKSNPVIIDTVYSLETFMVPPLKTEVR